MRGRGNLPGQAAGSAGQQESATSIIRAAQGCLTVVLAVAKVPVLAVVLRPPPIIGHGRVKMGISLLLIEKERKGQEAHGSVRFGSYANGSGSGGSGSCSGSAGSGSDRFRFLTGCGSS